MDANMPMIIVTTINSIRVNPLEHFVVTRKILLWNYI